MNFNVPYMIDCSSSTDCTVTVTNTKDFVLDCSSSTNCIATIANAYNSYPYSGSIPTYNVVLASSSTGPSFTFTGSDLVAVDCSSSDTCTVSITSPRNLFHTCTDYSIMHKIYA